jgi:predicted RNase H-like nuclease (RuvC/YqgF family)
VPLQGKSLDQALGETGAYDRIREELRKAALTDKTKDPEKRAKSLKREMMKLQAQVDVLQNEAARKSLAPEFSRKFPRLQYDSLLTEKINQLQREIDRIKSLPSP